ncbi:MAG: helix-turn-helix transcriptional regulator [Coriobacteriia bacterium]|nr:helix-turn-helix transcriptional regulator [Coriobacteriia bacterium]MBS5478114.1 helix-turn-helix transcriptional regulator [Coriobacteriia bacterium]
MLLRQIDAFDLGLLQTIAMALLIGVGLATAELSWLERLAYQTAAVPHARAIALSYFVGAIIASVIFVATGPIELGFALAILLLAALLSIRIPMTPDHANNPSNEEPPDGPRPATAANFVKATLLLIVFSFVFGAVSQASALAERNIALTEAQAIVGIAIAAGFMLLTTRRPSARQAIDLYWVLFPIVAITLVALPFLSSPAVLTVAVTLVFIAFYLIGMHVRSQVGNLELPSPSLRTALTSLALGLGAAAVLAGVLMGANALSTSNPSAGLTAIALVSLFVLSISPAIVRLIEQHGTIADSAKQSEGTNPIPTDTTDLNNEAMYASRGDMPKTTALPGDRHSSAPDPSLWQTTYPPVVDTQAKSQPPAPSSSQLFAEAHGLTQREAEVLVLICQGRTRTYIAEELGISPNTVKGYIHGVYQKAGAANKQDLIDRVETWGKQG